MMYSAVLPNQKAETKQSSSARVEFQNIQNEEILYRTRGFSQRSSSRAKNSRVLAGKAKRLAAVSMTII